MKINFDSIIIALKRPAWMILVGGTIYGIGKPLSNEMNAYSNEKAKHSHKRMELFHNEASQLMQKPQSVPAHKICVDKAVPQ